MSFNSTQPNYIVITEKLATNFVCNLIAIDIDPPVTFERSVSTISDVYRESDHMYRF